MAAEATSAGSGLFGWIAAGVVVVAGVGGVYYSGVLSPDPEPVADVDAVVETVTQPQQAAQQPAPQAAEAPSATSDPTTDPARSAPATASDTPPQDTAAVTPEPQPEPKPEPDASQTAALAPQADTPDAVPELSAPRFDVVRVDPDGNTVIAGTGTAASRVTIFLDNAEQDSVVVDGGGAFVSLMLIPPSNAPRILTLVADLAGQSVPSDDQIILAPTPQSQPEPEPDTQLAQADITAPATPPVSAATTDPAAQTDEPAAPETAQTDVAPTPEAVPETLAAETLTSDTQSTDTQTTPVAQAVPDTQAAEMQTTAQTTSVAQGTETETQPPQTQQAGAQPAPATSPQAQVNTEAASALPKDDAQVTSASALDATDPGPVVREIVAGDPTSETTIPKIATSETEAPAAETLETTTQDSVVTQDIGASETPPPAAPQAAPQAVAQSAAQDVIQSDEPAPADQPAPIEVTGTETAQAPTPAAPVPAPTATAGATTEGTTEDTTQQVAALATEPAAEPPVEQAAEQTPQPAPAATTPPAPAPVTVLRAGPDGVEVLQPAAPAPQVQDKIALDTISYSDAGEVQLSGRAQGQSVVRVYLDNGAVADMTTDDRGQWSGKIEGIEPGVYTLRLDELDTGGDVLSRLETPFKRESPEALRPPQNPQGVALEDTPLIRAVTVQTGDTLWAISRERYGDGFLYVRVFEANRDSIRNPDLIYPGQVFAIPE